MATTSTPSHHPAYNSPHPPCQQKILLAESGAGVCLVLVSCFAVKIRHPSQKQFTISFFSYNSKIPPTGSGVAGIPLTIYLYLIVTFVAGVILYLYFLKLHNNGRMLDVFFRLHGDEESFFMPHDLELSNQELSYIVKKAEQWRGADGERRKVRSCA